MNDKPRRALESGQRCRQWLIDYAALVPAGSLFETKLNELTAKVGQIEETSGELEAMIGEGRSATDVKTSERQDLLDIREKVRDAARAAEDDHPGTRDRYRYTVTMSNELLLATGRSFAAGEPPDGALLTSYGAPSHWWVLVSDACDAFEASFAAHDSAKGGSVAKNAELNVMFDELTVLKRTVGHMVKNFAATNPGAIAAWRSAAHVESGPKKKPPTP